MSLRPDGAVAPNNTAHSLAAVLDQLESNPDALISSGDIAERLRAAIARDYLEAAANRPVTRNATAVPWATPAALVKRSEWSDSLNKRQSFNGWRIDYGDCDIALYTAEQMQSFGRDRFEAGLACKGDANAPAVVPVQLVQRMHTFYRASFSAQLCIEAYGSLDAAAEEARRLWKEEVPRVLSKAALAVDPNPTFDEQGTLSLRLALLDSAGR